MAAKTNTSVEDSAVIYLTTETARFSFFFSNKASERFLDPLSFRQKRFCGSYSESLISFGRWWMVVMTGNDNDGMMTMCIVMGDDDASRKQWWMITMMGDGDDDWRRFAQWWMMTMMSDDDVHGDGSWRRRVMTMMADDEVHGWCVMIMTDDDDNVWSQCAW